MDSSDREVDSDIGDGATTTTAGGGGAGRGAIPTARSGDEGKGGGGKAESLRTIAGLIAVSVGLTALTLIAMFGMGFVKTDNPSVVSIASGAFTVIGTIVGAYFGVKAGNDNTQKAMDSTQKAMDSLKDESSKAAAFAAHMNQDQAQDAVATYQALRGSGHDPFGGSSQ